MLHMQRMLHAFLQGKHNNHDCQGEGEHRMFNNCVAQGQQTPLTAPRP